VYHPDENGWQNLRRILRNLWSGMLFRFQADSHDEKQHYLEQADPVTR
jgi:hypothetical protein